MPESQPEIQRLAPSTQTKLRSTQILTSLPQIVSELIQNSLDANPSQIHVGLDSKEWTCWVQDDGYGIPKDDLEQLGQADDRGRYSKPCYALNPLKDCSKPSKKLPKHTCSTLPTCIPSLPLVFEVKVWIKSSSHLFIIDWDSALASAADISCLEICSRTTKSRNTWSIILKVWDFNVWFTDFYIKIFYTP